MQRKVIQTDKAPAAIGPYSQAVRTGKLLFVSGQIPLRVGASELVDPTDVGLQTRVVMENIGEILKAAGLTFEHVVKSTIFLTDLANFSEVNEIYGSHFSTYKPARATVQVAALPKGAKVEIEVVASDDD
ncbi:MAG: RidA family protein [Myxococcales bacterium]|nr:MAG: RidA family protein [Myxococcales bacterium]